MPDAVELRPIAVEADPFAFVWSPTAKLAVPMLSASHDLLAIAPALMHHPYPAETSFYN
ncbi:MAG: hypothetical protein JSS64_02450 [Bacteroidetes bacterium]|nr:hypothetical protein [Bacteroidota bacterium]